MRVESHLSLYTRLGFSPKAHFIAAGSLTIMLSTRSPTVFMTRKVPPSTLALPGPVQTQVTPALRAAARLGSRGLMPSMARSWGQQMSFISL